MSKETISKTPFIISTLLVVWAFIYLIFRPNGVLGQNTQLIKKQSFKNYRVNSCIFSKCYHITKIEHISKGLDSNGKHIMDWRYAKDTKGQYIEETFHCKNESSTQCLMNVLSIAKKWDSEFSNSTTQNNIN